MDTAAIVVNAQNGIEMITNRMMQWSAKRNLCRLIIVNKIDAENVDLPVLLASIQEAFGKECLPINLPAAGGTKVVDCFFNPSGDSDFSSVEEAHRALVDQVVEVDEDLMALYLEQGEVSPEQLHAPFERALREGHLIPVCFVSARNGAGVLELLEIFAHLMPNPTEGNPPVFLKGEDGTAEEVVAVPDPKRHVLAHVFKVVVDPFVGRLGIFRVHQGTITRDTQLFIGDGRKPFKVGHMFLLQGKEHVETDTAGTGRHRCCRQGRGDRVRRGAARFPRRGPLPPASAGVSAAHVRARDRAASAAATSSASPTSCTSLPPRIPASGWNTAVRRTRR